MISPIPFAALRLVLSLCFLLLLSLCSPLYFYTISLIFTLLPAAVLSFLPSFANSVIPPLIYTLFTTLSLPLVAYLIIARMPARPSNPLPVLLMRSQVVALATEVVQVSILVASPEGKTSITLDCVHSILCVGWAAAIVHGFVGMFTEGSFFKFLTK
jgi:hypothetical protein